MLADKRIQFTGIVLFLVVLAIIVVLAARFILNGVVPTTDFFVESLARNFDINIGQVDYAYPQRLPAVAGVATPAPAQPPATIHDNIYQAYTIPRDYSVRNGKQNYTASNSLAPRASLVQALHLPVVSYYADASVAMRSSDAQVGSLLITCSSGCPVRQDLRPGDIATVFAGTDKYFYRLTELKPYPSGEWPAWLRTLRVDQLLLLVPGGNSSYSAVFQLV